jgi:hypothetical protein
MTKIILKYMVLSLPVKKQGASFVLAGGGGALRANQNVRRDMRIGWIFAL